MSAERAISCPSCGGAIAIKAVGYSVTLGCQYCGALLDVAHPDVAVIEKYEGAIHGLPLPLGARGTLFGTEWEVIGALARNDGDAYWTEFLLFNPYAGYRWLVHSEGDWQFGTMLLDRPVVDGSSVLWRGSRYTVDYDPSGTTTDRVVGEFYWRVKAGDHVTATTYSQGNDTLSAEWTDGEINWTQLVSLSAGNIYSAFGQTPPDDGWDDDDSPVAVFGDTNFDYARYSDLPKMFGLALGTIVLSLIVMMGFGISTSSAKGSLNVAVDGPEQSLTVGTIQVDRPYQAVTVSAQSSTFDNRWIDLDYMLVDQKTQQAHTAYDVVERYSGTDSDGAWTEGGYSSAAKFSAIPRGTYSVVVDASAHSWPTRPVGAPTTVYGVQTGPGTVEPGPWDTQSQTGSWDSGERIQVDFKASAGGVMWSNLWLELALLFGMPLLILWWRSD